jgi:hypothetical protein
MMVRQLQLMVLMVVVVVTTTTSNMEIGLSGMQITMVSV